MRKEKGNHLARCELHLIKQIRKTRTVSGFPLVEWKKEKSPVDFMVHKKKVVKGAAEPVELTII